MYKLLIADDEAFIRTGLHSLIEWEVYGIEIAGEAEDGMKAYLAIKSLKPDLVLVDISMPNMTGLELMELCSHLESSPKFIILSGYNDFQYVQKAMQLGAINYLLKPVNQDELTQTVISSVKLLDDLHAHQQQFQESLESLRNNVLVRVLRNRIDSRELREKCQIVSVSLHCSHMHVGVLKLLVKEKGAKSSNESRVKISPSQDALGRCQEICSRLCQCYVVSDTADVIAVIFKDPAYTLKEEDYLTALKSCSDLLLEEMQIAAIFALGMEANHLQEISVSYDDAVSKIEKSLILGTSIETQVLGSSFYPSVSYPDFLRHLEAEEKDKIKATIHTYFTEILASGDGENMDILKYYLIELVTYVLHSKYMVSFSETEITQKKQNAFSIISGTDSILQLEEKLNIFFLSLMEHAADASMEGSYSFMVQNALTYVNSNYTNDNLSLKTIAAEMEVNAAYLGREFARETGEFFNDYLNRIRIAKALHLLTTTTWKTAKVANSVGFVNISYFFTIFKKITGQSPGDYRATHV